MKKSDLYQAPALEIIPIDENELYSLFYLPTIKQELLYFNKQNILNLFNQLLSIFY